MVEDKECHEYGASSSFHVPAPRSTSNSHKLKMTDTEYILLSPFAKFSLHNRFPFKLILHSVLLLLVTSQVLVFNLEDSTFTRTMGQTFGYFFMPNKHTRNTPSTLYSVDGTLSALQNVSDRFYSLQESSVASIGYVDEKTGACYFSKSLNDTNPADNLSPLPPSVTVKLQSGEIYRFDHALVPGPVGDVVPFFSGENEFRNLMEKLDRIEIVLSACNVNTGYFFKNCYEWGVAVCYDFSNYANLGASINSVIVNTCDGEYEFQKFFTKLSHNVGILSASILYFILLLKEFLRKLQTYRNVKSAHAVAHSQWATAVENGREESICEFFTGNDAKAAQLAMQMPFDKLPLAITLKFFPVWLLFNTCTVILTGSFSLYVLLEKSYHIATRDDEKFICAFTCLCLWTGLINFFQHQRKIYSIILTLEHALPSLLPFLIGVFPIFLGYSLFAVSYFGNTTNMFEYPTDAFVQLFSVLNGDVIYLTFKSLWRSNSTWVNLYLFSFITIFMYLVLNVVIALVEHSYFLSQGKERTFDTFMARGFVDSGGRGSGTDDGNGNGGRVDTDNDDKGWKGVDSGAIDMTVSPNLFREKFSQPRSNLRNRRNSKGSLSPKKGGRHADRTHNPPSSPIKAALRDKSNTVKAERAKTINNLMTFADEIALREILMEEAKIKLSE